MKEVSVPQTDPIVVESPAVSVPLNQVWKEERDSIPSKPNPSPIPKKVMKRNVQSFKAGTDKSSEIVQTASSNVMTNKQDFRPSQNDLISRILDNEESKGERTLWTFSSPNDENVIKKAPLKH